MGWPQLGSRVAVTFPVHNTENTPSPRPSLPHPQTQDDGAPGKRAAVFLERIRGQETDHSEILTRFKTVIPSPVSAIVSYCATRRVLDRSVQVFPASPSITTPQATLTSARSLSPLFVAPWSAYTPTSIAATTRANDPNARAAPQRHTALRIFASLSMRPKIAKT